MDDNSRFVLHFKVLNEVNEDSEISIHSFDDVLYINSITQSLKQGRVELYNLMGQRVLHEPLLNNSNNAIDLDVNQGYIWLKYTRSQMCFLKKSYFVKQIDF